MDLERLKAALDQVAWREQVEDEYEDRHPGSWDESGVLAELRALAGSLRPGHLDELERSAGYEAWALRLSPMVAGDDSRARALRLLDSGDDETRYWALRLLDS